MQIRQKIGQPFTKELDSISFQGMKLFQVGKKQVSAAQVIEVLGKILTPERRSRIEEVVSKRTPDIVPVFDGPYDRGNVSAVIRSAESFGLMSLHIIETQERFKEANRATKGTDKWVDIYRWKSGTECIQSLKNQGYKIVATSLESSKPISEVDFSVKTALVLGNEKEGVSREVLDLSDERIIIPMQGFAQSFNISVAGAICFYHIYLDRIRRLGKHATLTDQQKTDLTAEYYMRTLDSAEGYFI